MFGLEPAKLAGAACANEQQVARIDTHGISFNICVPIEPVLKQICAVSLVQQNLQKFPPEYRVQDKT